MTSDLYIEHRSNRPNVAKHEDRQVSVLVFMALFGVVIPVIVLLGLLVPTAWMAVAGLHPHATLWGWLSEQHRARNGATVFGVAGWIAVYYLTLASTWIAYYFAELLGVGFRAFRRALTA